ncbi:MAG TPA: zinc ribbon domain-containing protein, partial [Pirellulaceae bacterium]|nr:zinc ribbon domain-containing protein [Pirellulaceae bacterium]
MAPPPTPSVVEAELIDQDARAPAGTACPACGSPVEADDKFCPACGTAHAVDHAVILDDAPPQKHFHCNNCGSDVATDPDQRSYVCPFCDSTYVVEFAPEENGRQRPEFVIGFAITPQQAQEMFYAWLRENAWYRPGDLVRTAVADKQKGVYLPFWSFSMLAQSR